MASSIKPAIDALVTLLAGWAGLDGVHVSDGPVGRGKSRKDLLTVGWSDSDGTIDFDREWAAFGAMRQEEATRIPCRLLVWSGGTDMTARRDRALAFLDEIDAAIASDRTLADTVRIAYVSGGALGETQTQSGAAAALTFTVTSQARISA